MMRVLGHMASYTSIDTPHFSVVIDPTQDELLAVTCRNISSRSTRP